MEARPKLQFHVKIFLPNILIYVGETSRSGYERGLEHQRDLDELKKDTAMEAEDNKEDTLEITLEDSFLQWKSQFEKY